MTVVDTTPGPGIAGLLLAAGAGRRFGMPKSLVEHRGRLLVELAADVLRQGGCRPVLVVLGAAADVVRARATLDGCVLIDNPLWPEGLGSSLRAGLDVLCGGLKDADSPIAAAVLPVDVPGVTAAAVHRVCRSATPRALRRASYHGMPGHPVLLGRNHWPKVREAARGDSGARDYLRRNAAVDVPCADIARGGDLDYPDDLTAWST